MRIGIFGAGSLGQKIYHQMKMQNTVVIVDNDANKQNNLAVLNGAVQPPEALKANNFEKVYVTVTTDLSSVEHQLHQLGVPQKIISTEYVLLPIKARIAFLESAQVFLKKRGINGSVAEAGVYRGEFSKEINRVFPQNKLYLFDTFEGFPLQDQKMEGKYELSNAQPGELADTSIEYVTKILPHPEQAVFCKGYFPQTGKDITDKFSFVNLDLDMYAPTLGGLKLFFPLMTKGGIILVHDYFNDRFRGVQKAVDEFLQERPMAAIPIGDGVSLALIK